MLLSRLPLPAPSTATRSSRRYCRYCPVRHAVRANSGKGQSLATRSDKEQLVGLSAEEVLE